MVWTLFASLQLFLTLEKKIIIKSNVFDFEQTEDLIQTIKLLTSETAYFLLS